jgi:hypothetical protein
MKWYNRTPCARVTDKAIEAAHVEAMKLLPAILEEVRKHYKK